MKKQAQTTAEAIAEAARDIYHETKYCAISPADIEKADAYTSEHMSITTQVMNILGISHASKRVLVCIALAMQDAATEPETAAEMAERAAKAMEEAEQQAAPEYIEPEHIQTVSGNKIYRSIDPVTGWTVFAVAGRDFWELAEARYFAQCNPAEQVEHIQHEAADTAETAEQAAAESEPAPTYQRYELEAYLGDPNAYDVDAIEAEATRFTANGARVWVAFGDDLAAIAERHELYSYAPAI